MKKCYKCQQEKPTSMFYLDKTRPDKCFYKCKDCCRGTIDKRKNRWLNLMSEEAKIKCRNRLSLYRKTPKGKAIEIISSYTSFDRKRNFSTDLTQEYVINALNSPCFYCGDKPTGLDRILNSVGHIMSNCVPCCKTCNVARMDNFTHEEMIIIGKTIRMIKALR